jgi:hypothetical protein
MHHIEPFFLWMDYYRASEDPYSPLYGYQNSEVHFTHHIYDYVIHPQWDYFGSDTLFLKILFVDYESGFAVIELLGEWNDCISNDIMLLKRDIIDPMIDEGINKFVLIGENVLNMHAEEDAYYEEWFQDVEEGWIALLNFQAHVLEQFEEHRLDYYLNFGGKLDDFNWRSLTPMQLETKLGDLLERRLMSPSSEDTA